VWTSADGTTWDRQQTNIPHGYLEEVIEFKGTVYAFGHELEGSTGVGPGTVWRSSDGRSWELASVLTGARGHWKALVTTDTQLIAFSASSVSGNRTWLTADGGNWQQPQGTSPGSYESAASLGLTVIVAGGVFDNHVGLAPDVSLEDGRSWQKSPVESDYEISPHLAANNGLLLAATSACCGVPSEYVGLTLASTDGLTWAPGEPLKDPFSAALAIPGGFVALSDSGSTAVTADGVSWFSGPPMPAVEGNVDERNVWAYGAGPTGVLFISADFRNAMEYDRRLWFAPMDAFDLSKWTTPAPLAQRPEVGSSYPANIDYCPYSIRMDGQVWQPTNGKDLDDFTGDENATVTLNDPENAIYTSDGGLDIPLRPIHPVPIDPDPGC